MSDRRITQELVEAIYSPDLNIRVTQEILEAIYKLYTYKDFRITQLIIEVVYKNGLFVSGTSMEDIDSSGIYTGGSVQFAHQDDSRIYTDGVRIL